jgi:hypothetical protein
MHSLRAEQFWHCFAWLHLHPHCVPEIVNLSLCCLCLEILDPCSSTCRALGTCTAQPLPVIDTTTCQVFDPLLEAAKGKFSKKAQDEKKRRSEWAGRSNV